MEHITFLNAIIGTLQPLMQAQRLRPNAVSRLAILEDQFDVVVLFRRAHDARMGVDHVGAIGGGPDGDVVVRVADVVEAFFAVRGHEPVELATRREIDMLVDGEHAIEDTVDSNAAEKSTFRQNFAR